MIRSLEEQDLKTIMELHDKYYKNEFALPDFKNNFHCVFTITDNDHNPVVIGGVRPIAEVVILTDKSKHIKDKVEALRQMLAASLFTAGRFNYRQIHCAITDPAYERHLKKIGFREVSGNFLVLDV